MGFQSIQELGSLCRLIGSVGLGSQAWGARFAGLVLERNLRQKDLATCKFTDVPEHKASKPIRLAVVACVEQRLASLAQKGRALRTRNCDNCTRTRKAPTGSEAENIAGLRSAIPALPRPLSYKDYLNPKTM